MTCSFPTIEPPPLAFRLARSPEPWAWPDWAHRGKGRPANRWDDTEKIYRVLYASTRRVGAFLETLARFRPDPEVLSEIARLDDVEGDPADDGRMTGTQLADWAAERSIGQARLKGQYVAIGRSDALKVINRRLADRLSDYHLTELDGASIRASAPVGLTQEISRLVYECTDANGDREFEGIRYLSRLGDDVENWAIFEPCEFEIVNQSPIELEDPDLRSALSLLNIEVDYTR